MHKIDIKLLSCTADNLKNEKFSSYISEASCTKRKQKTKQQQQ